MNEILDRTIPEIHTLLTQKKINVSELVQAQIEHIQQIEPKIDAYLTLQLEECIEEVHKLAEISVPKDNHLFGIPISVKDAFTTQGIRTTAASKMLENFVPPYDATAFKRLKEQNTVLMGKVNMDEFAHGFTCEYSAFKTTHNPWDTNTVPGGSSGGSAASVAAREAFLSLASENYGSIIQPASLCGITGMKPTYGRSSRYGVIAMASSLECPGIMAKCIEDLAIGITAISGKDPLDATSVDIQKEDYYRNLTKDNKNKKIGVIKSIFDEVKPEIQQLILQSIDVFKHLGITIEFIDWYDLDLDGKIYDVLYRAEVSSNLARYDGIRYGYRDTTATSLHEYYVNSRALFGKHVKRQIVTDPIAVTLDDNDIYSTALKLRRRNRDLIDNILREYDAILSPTTMFASLGIGQSADPTWREENRGNTTINAAMMCPTALYGYPSITFPVGFIDNKTPMGIQLFGMRFGEQVLFDLAYAFQEETGLKCLKPSTI